MALLWLQLQEVECMGVSGLPDDPGYGPENL